MFTTTFHPYTFEHACCPEEVGIPREAIAAFEERIASESRGHHGYIFYRHGKIAACSIASPYRFTDKRHVYSISKSWTSTAIGIAIEEGLLSVEDRVIDFFPDELPETVSENLAAMRVKHLLTMTTGHDEDTTGHVGRQTPGWARRFLEIPVEHVPGTHFVYNTTATYMLSAIITKLTGLRLIDYLKPRLLDPLGLADVWWEESPDGVNNGGFGIHISPEDMLRLGVLYLNGGVFNGMRILSEDFVSTATSAIADNSYMGAPDWAAGYGYQFWRCQHNSYRGDGACGQYIIVSPDQAAVAIIISETNAMQDVLNIYWETVFAAMTDAPLVIPHAPFVPAARPIDACPTHDGGVVAPFDLPCADNYTCMTRICGKCVGDKLLLTVYSDDRAAELVLGAGKWIYNSVAHCPISATDAESHRSRFVRADIAGSYGCEDDIVRMSLRFVSHPHGMKLVLNRKRGTLTLTRSSNGQSCLLFDASQASSAKKIAPSAEIS